MQFAALLVANFLQLTGPDQQVIEVNPQSIVVLRPPRKSDHFAPGTKCLVFLSDGKFLSVVDTCDEIRELIQTD